jgi:XkdW protein.
MNLVDILRLKFPDASFEKDIILQDDGGGVYIKEWNIPDIIEGIPNQEIIDQWRQEVLEDYKKDMSRQARASQYPSWQEQFDMQFHDAKNGTTVWLDTIQKIKDENP